MLLSIAILILPLYALPGLPDPCDPLDPVICYFPYPNDYWLVKDENMNPISLNFENETLPIDIQGNKFDPQQWNERVDGFPPIPSIMTYFQGVSLESSNLAGVDNIALSQEDSYPIILLDAESGERIPTWSEFDESIPGNTQKALITWPSQRLENSKNYIVAIRGLRDATDQLIEASDGFASLRDGVSTGDDAIEFRRDRYNDYIFSILTDNGISRKDLQLAFEFTVMSDAITTTLLTRMRDDAFSRIQNDNIEFTITSIQDNPFPDIARQIDGTMRVPYYLNKPNPDVDVRVVRAEDDRLTPVYQYMWDVPFEILIPQRLVDCPSLEARWLQYGHGTFSDHTQIEDGYLRHYANKYGYILGSTNWLSFSTDNIPPTVEIFLYDLNNLPMYPDRSHQGVLNGLFLMKLMLSSSFITNDVFVFDAKSIFDSQELINNIPHNFYGNSFGAFLGTVYMSLTTDVERGVLGVGGAPFDMMLARASPFSQNFGILKLRYQLQGTDPIFILSLFQLVWTASSPSGYMTHIQENLFPNTIDHQVLMHYSLGDAQTFYHGSEIQGRSMDCVMYESQLGEGPSINQVTPIFGFEFIEDAARITDDDVCLIQGWFWNPPEPVTDLNVPNNPLYDAHTFTRHNVDSQQANFEFFDNGIIFNPCDGACNNEWPTITFASFSVDEQTMQTCETYNVFAEEWEFVVIYFCPDIAFDEFEFKNDVSQNDVIQTLESIVIMQDNFEAVFSEKYGVGLKINNSNAPSTITYCIDSMFVEGGVSSGRYCVDEVESNCGLNFITVANICGEFTDLLMNDIECPDIDSIQSISSSSSSKSSSE